MLNEKGYYETPRTLREAGLYDCNLIVTKANNTFMLCILAFVFGFIIGGQV